MINDVSSLIGRTVLVGLTHYDTQGQMTRQEQYVADIVGFKKDSLVVTMPDKTERLLPLLLPFSIHRAPRGEYECLATGEKVTDPDFLSAWLIKDTDELDVKDVRPDSAPLFASQAPRHWRLTPRHDPEYLKGVIDAESRNYYGKRVLAGLTYYLEEGSNEEYVGQEQIHGEITRISYEEGIVIAVGNSEEYILPPELPMLEPAPPGEYNLQSTRETVVDPDFITKWIVVKPSDQ